ncbi:MAG: hypothetical protein WD824_13560 [Cyclobacteriaceae bacterium]
MYTSYIGKKFLRLYRANYNKPNDYSAQQFFDEVMFPLFFQDDSHLMHVGNSPFFQKPREEDIKKFGSKSLAQLNNLKKKIESGVPSGAIYVGFAAEEIQATSSGQLTSMNFNADTEEMYASWIGEALAIGVNGGFVMLIDENHVLLSIFIGWGHYRKYLHQTPNLKDKQIETWNGHWLCLSLNKNHNDDDIDYSKIETAEVIGNIAIPTKKWSNVIFALSKKYPNKIITAYSYNLSQTNTTLGFINLYLPEIRRLYELRDKIFINQENLILRDEEIEKLETFFNFRSACKIGTIGLKALEPAHLREYMPKGTADYAQGKDFKFSDENSYFNYQLYKLWIIAMLNKTELLQLASDVAKALLEHETKDGKENRGKTEKNQDSNKIKDSKNIREFIENLTELLEKAPQNGKTFKEVVDQVLKMPSDNFPLFATLIRFEYAYQKNK